MLSENEITPTDDILKEKNNAPEVMTEDAADETHADQQATGMSLQSALFADDDNQDQEIKRIKDIVKVLSIDGMWFRRQLPVFLLIMMGLILYITNRYQAQQEMIEEGKLLKELQDWKYRCMTVSSDLTTKCRQSQLEQRLKALGDSTLQINKTAPYEITEP